jgi:hypothetical protein
MLYTPAPGRSAFARSASSRRWLRRPAVRSCRHVRQHCLQLADRHWWALGKFGNHGLGPRYEGLGKALCSPSAFWIASRIPNGLTGNTSRAVLSRTTVGFFSPLILEEDGIVHREVYPEVPPEVEYSPPDYG